MSDLSQLAAQLGDDELIPYLSKPLEVETLNEVLFMMYLLTAACERISASARALQDRRVPFNAKVFVRLDNALNAAYGEIHGLPLSHAEARGRLLPSSSTRMQRPVKPPTAVGGHRMVVDGRPLELSL